MSQLKNKARREEQRENWSRAIEFYTQALDASRSDGEGFADLSLYNRIGDIYLRIGQKNTAVRYYEQAIERYADQDLHTSAIALCNKVLRILPQRSTVFLQLGRLNLETNLIAEARSHYHRYADAMRERGGHAAAYEALEELIERTGDPVTLRKWVSWLAEQADAAAAEARVEACREALEGQEIDVAEVLEKIRTGDVGELTARGTGAAEVDPLARAFLSVPEDWSPAKKAPPPELPPELGKGAPATPVPDPAPAPLAEETAEPGPPAAAREADRRDGDGPELDESEVIWEDADRMPEAGDWAPEGVDGMPEEGDWVPGDADWAPDGAEEMLDPAELIEDAEPAVSSPDRADPEERFAPTPEGVELEPTGATTDLPAVGEEGPEPDARSAEPAPAGMPELEAEVPAREDAPAETPGMAEETETLEPVGASAEPDPAPKAEEPEALEPIGAAAEARPRSRTEEPEGSSPEEASAERPVLASLESEAPTVSRPRPSDAGPRLEAPEAARGRREAPVFSPPFDPLEGGDEEGSDAGWSSPFDPVEEPEERAGTGEALSPPGAREATEDEVDLPADAEAWRAGAREAIDRLTAASAPSDEPEEPDEAEPETLDRAEQEALDRAEQEALDRAEQEALDWAEQEALARAEQETLDRPEPEALDETEVLDEPEGEMAAEDVEEVTGPLAESRLAAADEDPEDAFRDWVESASHGILKRALPELEQRNEREKALLVIRRLSQLEGHEVEYRRRYVAALQELGRVDEAVEASLALAAALEELGRPIQARDEYGRALGLAPGDERAREGIRRLEEETGAGETGDGAAPSRPRSGPYAPAHVKPSEPTVITTHAKPGNGASLDGGRPRGDGISDGDHPRPYAGVAGGAEASSDFEALLSEYRAHLHERPTSSDSMSRTEYGASLKEMGRLDDAIRELQAAVREPSPPPLAYELLGEAFLEKGQSRIAVRLLEKALATLGHSDREMLGVLYQLGVTYERLDDPSKALLCYERIFSVDIDYRDVQARILDCSS